MTAYLLLLPAFAVLFTFQFLPAIEVIRMSLPEPIGVTRITPVPHDRPTECRGLSARNPVQETNGENRAVQTKKLIDSP